MDKLQKLMRSCRCGVFLTINEHRDYYQGVEKTLSDRYGRGCDPDIEADVRAKMIELNTIIEIHFYPDTPIGFYEIFHYDLDIALTKALECIERKRNTTGA